MNAIVVNDLSMSTEMDRTSLTEILGGTSVCYRNGPWKYLGTNTYFKGWIKKGHKWYKRYLKVRKFKRCQYKYVKSYVCIRF